MRYFLILFAFIPLLAIAATYGGAKGENRLGEIIHIDGDSPDTIYVQKSINDHEWKEKYNFSKECPSFFNQKLKNFSCISNSKSPLAGTTYKVTTSKNWQPCKGSASNDKSAGTVYICIKGCNNKRAPKIFYVEPFGEC